MIEYRGFKANKHRLYETEPGVKLEFRGPDADMFAQVRAPKHPVKVVTFDLTEQEYWNLLFGEKCQRAGCERITIPAYCSHECRELDSQPLPPLVHTLNSKQLETKLLSLGGNSACLFDPDHKLESDSFIATLLALGRVSNGKGARLKQMQACNCHANAVKLAKRHPHVYQFETGYALVQGTWVRHSWAFDCRTNQIVETTVLRDKYFGLTHQPPAAVQELPPDDGGLVLPEVRSRDPQTTAPSSTSSPRELQ